MAPEYPEYIAGMLLNVIGQFRGRGGRGGGLARGLGGLVGRLGMGGREGLGIEEEMTASYCSAVKPNDAYVSARQVSKRAGSVRSWPEGGTRTPGIKLAEALVENLN